MNVLIICGGQSAEHEVSLQSTKSVLAAIDQGKFNIVLAGIDKGGRWNRYDPSDFLTDADDPSRIALANPGDEICLVSRDRVGHLVSVGGQGEWWKIDAAFPVLHGTFGEDGEVQTILNERGVPYTGSGATASRVAFDKQRSKRKFLACGVPTPAFAMVSPGDPCVSDPHAGNDLRDKYPAPETGSNHQTIPSYMTETRPG